MRKLFRFGLFVFEFAVLGLAAAFVVSVVSPTFADRVRAVFGTAAPPIIAAISPNVENNPPSTHGGAMPEREGSGVVTVSYAGAVARAAPAVVSITANKVVSPRPQVLMPTNPVMQRMFPGIVIQSPKQRLQSLGSGVIVGDEGYVVTNNHVIQGAEEIEVILYDGS